MNAAIGAGCIERCVVEAGVKFESIAEMSVGPNTPRPNKDFAEPGVENGENDHADPGTDRGEEQAGPDKEAPAVP